LFGSWLVVKAVSMAVSMAVSTTFKIKAKNFLNVGVAKIELE
jgi:hypothetical protein